MKKLLLSCCAVCMLLATRAQFNITRVESDGQTFGILTEAGKPFMGTKAQVLAKEKDLPKQPGDPQLLLLTHNMHNDTTAHCGDAQAIFYRLESGYWMYLAEQTPCAFNKNTRIADAKVVGTHVEIYKANDEAWWTMEVPLYN